MGGGTGTGYSIDEGEGMVKTLTQILSEERLKEIGVVEIKRGVAGGAVSFLENYEKNLKQIRERGKQRKYICGEK